MASAAANMRAVGCASDSNSDSATLPRHGRHHCARADRELWTPRAGGPRTTRDTASLIFDKRRAERTDYHPEVPATIDDARSYSDRLPARDISILEASKALSHGPLS
jgi:hypothetical protein